MTPYSSKIIINNDRLYRCLSKIKRDWKSMGKFMVHNIGQKQQQITQCAPCTHTTWGVM